MSCPDNTKTFPVDWVRIKILPADEQKPHPNQWLIDKMEKQQKCFHDFSVPVDFGFKCPECELIVMQLNG